MSRARQEKPYTVYRIRDENGEVVQEWDDRDRCEGWPPPCGGCGHCMALQAEHAGWNVESICIVVPKPPKRRTPWTFPVLWEL